MSVPQYAKHRGVAIRAVSVALNAKRISRDETGWIDSEQADIDWEKNTNPRKAAASKINGRLGQLMLKGKRRGEDLQAGRMTRAEAEALDPHEADVEADAPLLRGVSDTDQFTKARAVRERFAAMNAKLEYDQRTGKLIDRAEVLSAAYSHYRSLRDSLLTIPDRIAAQLAAETDAVAVHDLLSGELRLVLEKASTMKIHPPRREREQAYGNVG